MKRWRSVRRRSGLCTNLIIIDTHSRFLSNPISERYLWWILRKYFGAIIESVSDILRIWWTGTRRDLVWHFCSNRYSYVLEISIALALTFSIIFPSFLRYLRRIVVYDRSSDCSCFFRFHGKANEGPIAERLSRFFSSQDNTSIDNLYIGQYVCFSRSR